MVVNPRHVRDFAKATCRLAKTDRLDALLTRGRQLIEMLTAEQNRLGQVFVTAGKRAKKSLTSHITYL